MLATAHRLTEARNLIEAGSWRDEFTLATQISGSTIGIIGFGRIGKRVGRLLTGFDVDILTHDPHVPEMDTELIGGSMTSLSDLLKRSDVIVLTTELTEETRGLIGEPELACMQSSAILVNTARGPVVKEQALIDALRSESIAGAGLDVFSTEPLSIDSPLLKFENVVVTPHTSAVMRESRTKGITQLTDNVKQLLNGNEVSEQYIAEPTTSSVDARNQ